MISSLQNNGYILRAPEPEDIDCLLLFENTAEEWSGNGEISGPYSRYQMKLYLEHSKNNIYDDRQLRLMVENKEKKIVGIVDICCFDPFSNKAEVGIIISPEFRKQGIGEIVLNLLEEHCFRYLSIHMLYAYINENNKASFNLFKKCGFNEAGILKDWTRLNGKYHNILLLQKINPY